MSVSRDSLLSPNSSSPSLPWGDIRLFAMDVDGVLTDGTIIVGSDGRESKQFSILDGSGLVRLREAGIELAWISGRVSNSTSIRAQELKIAHLIQGRSDKIVALQELASGLRIPPEACCYMGDDEIDVPAICWAGIGVSVKGGMPSATHAARYIPMREPGRGAVREVCDLILAARGVSASKS
ncbi:MAG: HAD hydrolase family protein [Opitutaceae bacterium]|nr:HAD hydrolase family protein [Opitutaceae bacterium]